jgi:hypothetical protein
VAKDSDKNSGSDNKSKEPEEKAPKKDDKPQGEWGTLPYPTRYGNV